MLHAGETSGGKYDAEASEMRKRLEAEGIAFIVAGGNKGSGFSVQGNMKFMVLLPEILEEAAASMRRQMQNGEFE